MYTKNNKINADAGKYLQSGLSVAYSFPEGTEDVEEKDIVTDDMELRTAADGSMNAHCTGGLISFGCGTKDRPYDFSDLKAEIVKKRYSYDDQIAIQLNRDDESEAHILDYTRMQDWRAWASQVCTKITSLYDNEQ